MARRLPEPPPLLDGYTYVRPLGSGGFADVYLYEQSMPQRTVAVKALLSTVASVDVREMFLSETTLMAQLAAHPSVLTVYEASIAPDGRPYLAMEYCPSSYGQRFRTEQLPLSEVLRAAIAIGSVLETAHRDGVLHRDIKPGNILLTRYDKPVLADFGIASTIARSERQEAAGLSIPWSAPEVISGMTQGTVKTEVYAFAATIYSLLAGRSPFERPGEEISRDTVMRRIVGRQQAAPTGRADAPPTLERVLAAGLAKDPARRPESILEMLREIQLAETELGLRPSSLDIVSGQVIDTARLAEPVALPARSERSGRRERVRRSASDTQSTGRSASSGRSASGGRSGGTGAGDTVLRAWSTPSAGARYRRRRLWGIGGGVAGVVVVAVVAVGAILAVLGGGAIPSVTDVTAETSGDSVTFRWDDPGLTADDRYLVRVDGAAEGTQTSRSLTVDRGGDGARVCATVTVVRDGRNGEPSDSSCSRD